MLKKMLAAAGLAAGLALLAPAAAQADTGYQTANVGPGQTFCVRDSAVAYNTARGEGAVLSGHQVRFTFGTTTRTVYDTSSPVAGFAAETYSYLSPGAFPGRAQVCAINQSQKASTVRLRALGS